MPAGGFGDTGAPWPRTTEPCFAGAIARDPIWFRGRTGRPPPSNLRGMSDLTIFTIGHSTRSLDELAGLLEAHGIELLVDVRRFPASRRHPQFQAEALGRGLTDRGIDYLWLEELGGRRAGLGDASPNQGLEQRGFRGYADHMMSESFRSEAKRLIAEARRRRTAMMCAEAVYWRCHRRLIADYLEARGVEVRHILDAGPPRRHRWTPTAEPTGQGVRYPSPLFGTDAE